MKGSTAVPLAHSHCASLLEGYVTNHMPAEAIRLFKEIEDPSEVNVILLFNACAQLGTPEALSLVNAVSTNIPKSFFYNPRINASLLDAFIKCKDLESAHKLFATMYRSEIN